MTMRILSINPGSTSTKIAVYDEETRVFQENLKHSTEELSKFEKLTDQFDFRKDNVLSVLKEKEIDLKSLKSVVGRGGLLKPMEGGTYLVNDRMMEDLKIGIQGVHASNLGGLIANSIAQTLSIPAYIADPVVVDEICNEARISGHPLFPRKSIFHALNQKAIAKLHCKEKGLDYKKVNLIVAHIGGGVSVGLHSNGRVVDVNNALDGDGPFAPERSGSLPMGAVIEACFSGKYSKDDMKKAIVGKGGLVAYFGTNDCQELEEKAKKDKEVKLVLDALSYQIAKEIGALSTIVSGKVDAILLTGGIAHSKVVTGYIENKTKFIAPVHIYGGEDEMWALAGAALRVLKGEEKVKTYS
ncbi:MAG: butyrate kinase [Firmicutes bacterium]|nr:butyrate kinase [Bacillota bacterium]MCL2256401.1 butyrate kinase [Bacillota bacterium]